MKVLITGGSGMIGTALTKALLDEGIAVTHLTRYKNSKMGIKTYEWDWKRNYIEEGALNEVTHIVHLAGVSIVDKPWSMSRKRLIVKSRVLTARLLEKEIRKQGKSIEAFISASGTGYYGAVTTDKTFTEEDTFGADFAAECCRQWENAAQKYEDISRVAIIRTGIVLSNNGGAVTKIQSSVKRGLGAPIGTGEQIMPWIHIDDMVHIYMQAIKNKNWSGIYNAVADNTTNAIFTKSIADALNKKMRLPNVPAFMLKLIFGEMAELLLNGSKISTKKIEQNGFQPKYTDINTAMKSVL